MCIYSWTWLGRKHFVPISMVFKISTEHNLTHLTNKYTLPLTIFFVFFFLDLKKPLDVCSDPILLEKLKYYGTTGVSIDIESFWKDRQQSFDINGTLSLTKTFNMSVIKVSILGQFCSSIFRNDLFSFVNRFMFGNDIAWDSCEELRKVARLFGALMLRPPTFRPPWHLDPLETSTVTLFPCDTLTYCIVMF